VAEPLDTAVEMHLASAVVVGEEGMEAGRDVWRGGGIGRQNPVERGKDDDDGQAPARTGSVGMK